MEAFKITQASPIFSDNLAPNFVTFNKDVDYTGWNVVSGTGIAANDDTYHFKGDRSLYIYATNKTTAFVINSGGTQTEWTATEDALHRIQFRLLNPPTGQTTGTLFQLNVFKNGIPLENYDVTADMMDGLKEYWKGFYVEFLLEDGDVISVGMTKPANNVSGDSAIHFDGFKPEVINKDGLDFPSIYSEPPVQIPPTPADGIWYMDKTVGFNTWKDLSLLLPNQLTIPIDFPSINAGEFYDYEYNASPLTFSQGQVMLVRTKDETNPALDFTFTARRKGSGVDASKLLIRAKNNTASPVNLGATDYLIKIFP